MEENQKQSLSLIEMGAKDFTETVERLTDNLVAKVQDGFLNPLEAKCKLSKLQKCLEKAEKAIISEVNSEIDKYSTKEKTIEYMGFKITRSETKKYDFSGIGEWEAITAEIKRLDVTKKNIEDKYKTASADNVIVDTTTGEEITSVPYSVTTRITVK